MRAEIAATPDMAPIAPLALRGRERAAAGPSGEIETALIGTILWRRRKAIALAAVLAGLCALGYSLLATKQFTAVAQILVDPRDKQVVSNDVNPSSIAADGGVTQVESQASVLQSNGVLLRAIAATHLESDSEFNGSGFLANLGRLATLYLHAPNADEMAERLKTETLETLRKHVAVKRADKALVLDLSVRAKTADRAAELANSIADAYLADQAETRASGSRKASEGLTARLGELQGEVQRAEDAVADYRASHDFVVSTGQLVSDQELNQTTTALEAARSRTASLRAQLDQLRAEPGSQGTPEAMASGVMVRLRDRESAIVEKLGNASKLLGPLHPDIASLKQSLADVRGLIAREVDRLREAAAADYARAAGDEKALASKLKTMKSKSLDDDKADVHLRELQAQAESARAVYQAFLTRSKETLEAANVDTTNARVITRALPPLQKSWPPTSLLLLGASLFGLSLGATGALAREYMRPTLLTGQQARDLIGAPVLGVISSRDWDTAGPRGAEALASKVLRVLEGDVGAEGVGACLYLASPAAAAAFRRRLAERIAARAGHGRQALLVDADLAGANEDERPGLLDFLRGEQTATDLAYREQGEAFQRLARGGGDPWLAPPRGQGDAFRLRRLRRQFDLIALDGGLISDNPRLAGLAAEAELVLLVGVIGDPQADLVREAASAHEAGARVDAIVLVDPTGA